MRWPLWRVAVANRSMEPVLMPGDWLVVWRGFGPGNVKVRPGHIVIARPSGSRGMLLVKRASWRDADGWWLTSDNPGAGGVDSFRFGPVRAELIEGRVLGRYWPVSRRR